MVINSPCLPDKKELAISGQMATGKELLNLLMAGSLPKTITCLEKSDENAEFHQIIDFLSTCSINYALTVSPTIYASYIEQFWNTATSKTINSVKKIHVIVNGKAVVISESSVRSNILFNDEDGTSVPLDHGADKAIHKEGGDSVERAITTVASLDADNDNIIRTQTTEMLNVDIPQGTDTSGSPRRQETMGGGGTPAQTKSERVLEHPNELPLSEGHTSRSGEGNELITLCTKLSKQVLDLEKEKDDQAVEILNLKKRVKKLERKRKLSISHPRRRKYRQVETSSDDDLDEEDASK
ncbi:hypothetical protein Tco_0072064 [Tanacetum coccineum]